MSSESSGSKTVGEDRAPRCPHCLSTRDCDDEALERAVRAGAGVRQVAVLAVRPGGRVVAHAARAGRRRRPGRRRRRGRGQRRGRAWWR